MPTRGRRYKLNALKSYIISALVRQKMGVPHDLPLDRDVIIEAADKADVDFETLGKFCAVSTKVEVLAAHGKLNKVISYFSDGNFETWAQIDEVIDQLKLDQNLHYGRVFPTKEHSIIVAKGNQVLRKIQPDLALSDLDVSKWKEEVSTTPNESISQYLNTTWHAYFYYPHGGRYGSIIRTVIHIGKSPNEVSTYSPSDPKLDDFSGSVSFDKGEMVLNYNMTTKNSGRRGLHIKQYIHGGDNVPEVTIGEYLNIGTGGSGLHNIRLIMELQKEQINDHLNPKILNEFDPGFHELPIAYKKYLKYEKSNYREIRGRGTYTLGDLEEVVKNEKKNRFVNRDVRLEPKFQVYISFPRYSLKKDEYSKYYSAIQDLKNHWSKNYPLEIMDCNLAKTPPTTPERYYVMSDNILDADIVIGLFYSKNSSLCTSEITIATERGKSVFGFTVGGSNKSLMPEIFNVKWPTHVDFFFKYPDVESAINYLKDEFVHIKLNNEMEYFSKSTK